MSTPQHSKRRLLIAELTQFLNAQKFKINHYPPGTFLDWHPAPQRCVIVILSGIFEIGVSDGTTMQFRPGDLRFTSDAGKGHTGRVIGDEPCVTLMMYHDNEIQ